MAEEKRMLLLIHLCFKCIIIRSNPSDLEVEIIVELSPFENITIVRKIKSQFQRKINEGAIENGAA